MKRKKTLLDYVSCEIATVWLLTRKLHFFVDYSNHFYSKLPKIANNNKFKAKKKISYHKRKAGFFWKKFKITFKIKHSNYTFVSRKMFSQLEHSVGRTSQGNIILCKWYFLQTKLKKLNGTIFTLHLLR